MNILDIIGPVGRLEAAMVQIGQLLPDFWDLQ